MKVGFDISQVAHTGGVATYTQNLTSKLSKLKELEMVFFYSSLRQKYEGSLKNVKSFKLPPSIFEILFNQIRVVNIEKFIGNVDIFHSSDWVQPPTKARKITTYHDVIPLKYPEWSHPKIIEIQRRRLKIIEREIDHIIAVSNQTKKDLLEISNIPKEKITVVYEGVSENFKPQNKEDVERFRKKNNLQESFILAISGVGNRRNLERVKEASKKYNLIILGEDINLSVDELPLLYASSKILLYPSFYEGFGLPILEAMASGTAVITSNVSSMPEVGGEAPLYVDPASLEDITKKVREVMENEKLRGEMVKKGFVQAKKFSWKKTADETLKVYISLL